MDSYFDLSFSYDSVQGRGEIEPASAMLGPRRTSEGRVKSDDKLARGMDGMGGKVVGARWRP